MNRVFCVSVVAAVLAAANARAADIMSWETPHIVTGDTDVITEGTLDRAYNMGGATETTINGVPFGTFGGGAGPITVGNTVLSESGKTVAVWDFGDIKEPPYGNLSTAYKTMLQSTVYQSAGVYTPLKLTLNGLTVGKDYLFQTWVNYSGDNTSTGQRTQTIQVVDDTGSSGTLHWSSTPGTNGGLGDYVVGRFKATSTSLTLNYNGVGVGQLNGFQLRVATELATADKHTPVATAPRIPLIDVTDLYHPPQDPGDNFDILAAYGLPEVELKAVILDVTEALRTDERLLTEAMIREGRGRDAGFIPVLQLNAIFNRDVPCATTPYLAMKSVGDKMLDAPRFQQQGVELIVKTLRESAQPVHIVSFGSARAIAVAYNREPELFRQKLARLHLCAGQSSPPIPNYREHNVSLDPLSIVCLLRSDLPIAIYPDASTNLPAGSPPGTPAYMAGYGYDDHNTYYNLPDRQFITKMDPPLRRYLTYAFSQSTRPDFLRMMEIEGPPLDQGTLTGRHDIWETGIWIVLSGRKLVKRADGSYRIVPAAEVVATDKVLPNELHPCTVTVHDNGIYEYRETTQPTNFSVYYRGNPRENEAALREALPALYLSFKTGFGKPKQAGTANR